MHRKDAIVMVKMLTKTRLHMHSNQYLNPTFPTFQDADWLTHSVAYISPACRDSAIRIRVARRFCTRSEVTNLVEETCSTMDYSHGMVSMLEAEVTLMTWRDHRKMGMTTTESTTGRIFPFLERDIRAIIRHVDILTYRFPWRLEIRRESSRFLQRFIRALYCFKPGQYYSINMWAARQYPLLSSTTMAHLRPLLQQHTP